MEKIKWEALNGIGDHITMEHFLECCETGCFIDYDGFGHYASETRESNKSVYPSDVTGRFQDFDMETGKSKMVDCDITVDKTFTHIVWYNR